MIGWTEREDTILGRLWIDGKSASEIASALKTGRSRNSVIGRVHRLGMSRSSRAVSESRRTATARAIKTPKVERNTKCRGPKVRHNRPGDTFGAITVLDAKATEAKRAEMRDFGLAAIRRVSASGIESPNATPLLEYRTGCKWPLGERGAIRFCCNPVRAEGGPYCSAHHAVSVNPQQPAPVKEPRGANDHARKTPRPRVQTDWDFGREAA